jgi:hypothetical protein
LFKICPFEPLSYVLTKMLLASTPALHPALWAVGLRSSASARGLQAPEIIQHHRSLQMLGSWRQGMAEKRR